MRIQRQRLEQIGYAVVNIVIFELNAGNVHVQVFVVGRQFLRTLVVFQSLRQHLVLAQIDAEVVEQMLVFGLKSAVELDEALKDILSLGLVAAFQIGQADTEIGAHILFVHLEGAGVFVFGGKVVSVFALPVGGGDGLFQLLHLRVHGIHVEFRLGRKLGDQLVHADLALGTAGNIVGVQRLTFDVLPLLFHKPECFLDGLAGGRPGSYAADFLCGKDAAHFHGLAGRRGRRVRCVQLHAVSAKPSRCAFPKECGARLRSDRRLG